MGLWFGGFLLCLFLAGAIVALFFSRRPLVKWAASASASCLVVSLLLIGLSSDSDDQPRRDNGRSPEQLGVTDAWAWQPEMARKRPGAAAANDELAETRRQ